MDTVTLITAVISSVSLANYFFYKLYMVKLSQIEKRLEKLDNFINELDKNINTLTERIARLEAIVNNINNKDN